MPTPERDHTGSENVRADPGDVRQPHGRRPSTSRRRDGVALCGTRTGLPSPGRWTRQGVAQSRLLELDCGPGCRQEGVFRSAPDGACRPCVRPAGQGEDRLPGRAGLAEESGEKSESLERMTVETGVFDCHGEAKRREAEEALAELRADGQLGVARGLCPGEVRGRLHTPVVFEKDELGAGGSWENEDSVGLRQLGRRAPLGERPIPGGVPEGTVRRGEADEEGGGLPLVTEEGGCDPRSELEGACPRGRQHRCDELLKGRSLRGAEDETETGGPAGCGRVDPRGVPSPLRRLRPGLEPPAIDHPMDEPPDDLPRDVFEEGVLNESKRDEAEAGDELENGALSKRRRKGPVLAGDTGVRSLEGWCGPCCA